MRLEACEREETVQSAAAAAERRLQLRSLYSQGGVSTVAQPREGMRDGVVRVIPSRLDKHTEREKRRGRGAGGRVRGACAGAVG